MADEMIEQESSAEQNRMAEQKIEEKADLISEEAGRFLDEIGRVEDSGSAVGGYITIPNVFKDERASDTFRQILASTEEFGTREAPVALTSPESVVLFRALIDENDVNKFPSKSSPEQPPYCIKKTLSCQISCHLILFCI